MPFQSEKQRRYLWANEPEIARDWADTYGSRIEKNDGGIMRVKLATGMSPGQAQARGLGAQHHGSTKSWDKTRETERRDGPTAGHVPGLKPVAPQTQIQIDANQRAQLLAERKDKKEKESIFKKLQRKAITWDLKKRLQKKLKSPTYDPEAAAYGIFDEDTETLQDQIDRANLPFGDPNYYGQKNYTKDYGVDTSSSDGEGGYRGYRNYEAWFAAQNIGTGVTEVDEVAEVVEDPRNFQGLTMAELPYPKYHERRIPAAFGGIMDSSTGRRGYFLGSIGKAFGSIAKAAKKVFKSDVGKAALLGAGIFGLRGAMPTGWKNKLFMKQLTAKTAKDAATYGGLDWGKAAVWASPLLATTKLGEVPDDVTEDFDHDLLKKQYADEILRIKKEAKERALDQNEWNYLGVKDGGRIGLYAGGQSTPSDYTMEDAMMTTTQDKLGGITDVMKQADLHRQGSVGQFYAAHGGSADDKLMARIKELQDEGLDYNSARAQAEKEAQGKAQGGRIGYAHGGAGYPPVTMGQVPQAPQAPAPPQRPHPMPAPQPNRMAGMNPMMGGMNPMARGMNPMARGMNPMGGRRMAQEGGLMDLGGMEKDYRQEGGFVPLGGEEKADDVPARLSKNEFVFTADAVRAAGGGDVDAGAEIMENVMENLEQGGQISEETQGLTGAQEMFGVSERLSEVV